MGKAKKRYTVYMKTETKDKLHELSEITRVPMSQYVEEAIEDLLKKYEDEMKKPT